MPPAALKPTRPPASSMTSSSRTAASSVAPTGPLPVEVLRKSTPAMTAARAAAVIRPGSASVPVSRISLSVMRRPGRGAGGLDHLADQADIALHDGADRGRRGRPPAPRRRPRPRPRPWRPRCRRCPAGSWRPWQAGRASRPAPRGRWRRGRGRCRPRPCRRSVARAHRASISPPSRRRAGSSDRPAPWRAGPARRRPSRRAPARSGWRGHVAARAISGRAARSRRRGRRRRRRTRPGSARG